MEHSQKTLELEFTILEFFKNYVISMVREGAVLDQKQLGDLVEVCSDYYNGRNFVYLSRRINDFDLNPTILIDLEDVENLAGIGVIAQRKSSVEQANLEKNFCKLPYEIFHQMDKALLWAEKIVEEKNQKADL